MDVYDRRRDNLIELLKTISAAELSRKSGVSPSYISRCLKTAEDRGYKTIGEVTARKFESGGKKPEGWLDGAATVTPQPASTIVTSVSGLAKTSAGLTLGHALEFLADYLAELRASDRRKAMMLIDTLESEPEGHAQIAAAIEAIARTPFAQDGQKAA